MSTLPIMFVVGFMWAFILIALFAISNAINRLGSESLRVSLHIEQLGKKLEKISEEWLQYEKTRIPRRPSH